MKVLRKLLIGFIWGVSIVGWCISASYLLVNLKEIPSKILQRQDIQENEIRGTISDFENLSENPKESILFSKKIDTLFSSDSKNKLRVYMHLLETMSVDLSAVTPFILLWFFSSLMWTPLSRQK